MNAACSEAHLTYLGFDADSMLNLPPDRLQLFAYFIPTEEDFAAGARWFRCDALVEPLAAGESTTIDGTLEDVYGGSLPAGYRLCEARLGQTAACDDEHELEYLASVDLSDVAEYPAQRGDPQVAAACREPLLTALDLTVERQDLDVRVPAAAGGPVAERRQGGHLRGRRRRRRRARRHAGRHRPQHRPAPRHLTAPRHDADSVVVDAGEGLELVEAVPGVDEPDRARS